MSHGRQCMSLNLVKWAPLLQGHCPRCGAVVQLSNLRVNPQRSMVVCPNDYSVSRVKKLADNGQLKPCGFLWYAPWSKSDQ